MENNENFLDYSGLTLYDELIKGHVDDEISSGVSAVTVLIENEKTRAEGAESALSSGKADKATTLAGYGITNAYTKDEVNTKVSAETTRATNAENALSTGKADKATTLAGYGITDAYTKGEVNTNISAATEDCAYLGQEDGSAVTADFDPQADTVWNKAQVLSSGQKAQARQNIDVYSKAEINSKVASAPQNYVTVETYAELLQETGSGDTIYRVSSYNGTTSQVDPTVYSEYAWDGSSYVLLAVKSQVDEVFDISVYHGGTSITYANLAAALDSNNGGGVPSGLQRGGMSVKFVQSSDNKYVQYRLMSDSFNTTPSNWQGVDDAPTAGSNNLVKSGGVKKVILKLIKSKNLFNKNDDNIAVGKYYYPEDGELYDNANFESLLIDNIQGNAYYCLCGFSNNAIVVFFNSSGTFISGIPINLGTTPYFQAPANASKIGLSVRIVDADAIQLEVGKVQTEYEDFNVIGSSQINNLNGEKIWNNSVPLSKISDPNNTIITRHIGKNLFNKDSELMVVGKYYYPEDGELYDSDNFESLLINGIQSGQYYVLSGYSNNATVVFFNSDGTFISGIAINLGTNPYFQTPANTAFIGLSIRIIDAGKIQLEKGNTATFYAPYEYGIDGNELNSDSVNYQALKDDVKDSLKRVIRVGSTREYTSILAALKAGGENCRVIVDSGTYDIEQEYKDYYGNDFFTNYPVDGYHQHYDDLFYAGLYLDNGVELIGNGVVTLSFPYDEGTRITDVDHSDPSFDPVAQYFSILNPSQNNVIEGIDVTLVLNNCRYHVHDDFASKEGTNVFKNMSLAGVSQKLTAFGCGMGTKNTYVIDSCRINCGDGYSISYHNNVGSGKNKLIIKDTWCSGNIMARRYGTSTEKTEVIVCGCKANQIVLDYVDQETYPNDNMELIQWNNITQ